MASVISTVRGRARGQASANTETTQGVVTNTYIDADGNVTGADVRLHGLPRPLTKIANSSGIRLWRQMNVILAWTRGSRFAPVILSAAGAEGGNVLSSAASAAAEAAQADQNTDPDLSGVGFLLIGPDETVPDGYELIPGANTLFEDAPPGTTSGGAILNGRRTITVRPLVLTSLPGAGVTALPDGTLVDLVDGSGDPLGMYRLDKSIPAWKRRDAGSGGSGVVNPFKGAYDPLVAYFLGNQVKYQNPTTGFLGLFSSLVDGNTGNVPDTSPASWILMFGFGGVSDEG